MSVRLQTKCLWVQTQLLSLKLAPVSSKEFLDFQATTSVTNSVYTLTFFT